MTASFPQFVSQDICLFCDGCCRFKTPDSFWRPKMTQEEKGAYSNEFDDDNYVKAVEASGRIQCIFFHKEDNLCRIYRQRPFECQLYPFLLMKKGKHAALGVHLSCPHVQEKWQSQEFNMHVEDLRRYFQKEEVLEILRKNRALLSDYSNYGQEIDCLFTLEV